MRLLVSVRCAAEVAAAVEGGADIVDAKEPARGSLGRADAAVLDEIATVLPGGVPFSIALGDLPDPGALATVMAEIPPRCAARTRYLKLGFAGVAEPGAARQVLAAAVARATASSARHRVVAVAYADHRHAGSPSPDVVLELAAESGSAGVLLDTYSKDGRDLFAWITPSALRDWVGRARGSGLLTAAAGSLGARQLPLITEAAADIVGIRGAACEGGRAGMVTAARVRAVRALLKDGSPVAVSRI